MKLFIKFSEFLKRYPLFILYSGLFIYFLTQKYFEHTGFNTHFWDNYYFDQAIYNITIGKGFFLDNFNRHFFTEHFYPLYYLIAPLYLIKPSIFWTMLIHVFCLLVTLIPIVKYTQFRFPKQKAMPYIVIAFAFFIYVPFRGMNMTALHGEILMAPMVAWICYYLGIGKYRLALYLSLTLPLFKENAIVLLLGIALFLAIKRQFKLAIVIFSYGLVCALIVVLFIMPSFGLSEYRFVDNYAYLNAESVLGVMLNIMTKPLLVLNHLFSGNVIGYLMGLFALVLFLPMFSPLMLIGVVLLLQNALSDYWGQLHFLSHYSAPLVPIILMASIDGYDNLQQGSIQRFNRFKSIAKIVIPFFIVLNILYFTLFEMRLFYIRPNSAEIHQQINQFSAQASICASPRLAPHLFYRERISEFPHCINEDFIFVEKNDPYFPINESTDEFAKKQWRNGNNASIIFQLIIGERIANRQHYQQQLDNISKDVNYKLIDEGQRYLLYARK